MSTDSIPLNVVYERVNAEEINNSNIESNIPVDNLIESCSSDNELLNHASSYSSDNTSYKVDDKENKKLVMKICSWFGIFFSISAIFFFIASLTLFFSLYVKVNRCFSSNELKYKELITQNTSIKNIHLNVVSGIVYIEHHESSDIIIRVYEKHRANTDIDHSQSISNISLVPHGIYVTSESPAFNFETCQHASIQIFIPRHYPQKISITGTVKTGSVSIISDKFIELGQVEINVEVGFITVDQVNAQSLYLSTDLGMIEVYDTVARSVKLLAHTGSIRTFDIVTKNLDAITKYGSSTHKNIVSDKILVDTKWGYSKIKKAYAFTSAQDITMRTEYGKSILKLKTHQTNLNFTMEKKNGNIIVKNQNDENLKCQSAYNRNHSVLVGHCISNDKEDSKKSTKSVHKVHINLDTKYGASHLYLK
jgi:archaellum component FlaF (FlaF/FlaG flagellin family)